MSDNRKSHILTIIVTFNGERWVDKCVQSVLDSAMPSDLFVWDNGSTDSTLQLLDKYSDSLTLVKSNENLGFGEANNRGLKYAVTHGYDYVYLLNQDAYIFPETLGRLVDIAGKNASIGVFSPMQLSRDERTLDLGFEKICRKKNNHDKNLAMVDYCMAAHWLIPIRTLQDVGGFSSTFGHNGEDWNYCERVRYHGYGIGIVENAMAVHDRNMRVLSRSQYLHLSNASNLVKLSNPDKSYFRNILSAIYHGLSSCITFKSLKPLTGMIRNIIKGDNYKNYRLSKEKGMSFI